jgi:signal transduction histidine kinase
VTRRQQILDAGLALAIGIVTQLEIWAPHALITPTHMTAPRAVVSVTYAVAALALVFRSRCPLAAVTVAAAALAAGWIAVGSPESFGSFVLVMVMAYSVAANAARIRAFVGLGVILALAAVWTAADPKQVTVHEHLAGLAWLAPALVVWLTGLVVHRHRVAERRLARTTARREREERARAAVDEERTRIARELHDAVGHSVSVMTLQASAVRRLLKPDQAKELEALEAVERTGREALAEMRRMVGILRDPEEKAALAPQPRLAQLDRLIEEVREAGLPIRLDVEGEPLPLPPGLDLTAYRVVQEGLTNALKHANATAAQVLVRFGSDQVEIEVTDDGRGVADTDDGYGLIGLRERIAFYGGELAAGPGDKCGFRLRARLPVAPA